MGMRAGPYWASWTLYAFGFIAASTLMLMAVAALLEFHVFTNCNPLVMISMFLVRGGGWKRGGGGTGRAVLTGPARQFFGGSMMAVAFFLSTVMQKCEARGARTASRPH